MTDDCKVVEATLKIKLKSTVENVKENDKEALRYMVEDDLQELGYEVCSVEISE